MADQLPLTNDFDKIRTAKTAKAIDDVKKQFDRLLAELREAEASRDWAEIICEELEHFEDDATTSAMDAIKAIRHRAQSRQQAIKDRLETAQAGATDARNAVAND